MANQMSPDDWKKLQDEYRNTIPHKIESLKGLVVSLQKTGAKEHLEAVRLIVHKMVGSSGTYGFVEASQICRKWENEIVVQLQSFPPSAEWIAALPKLIQEIEKAFHGE